MGNGAVLRGVGRKFISRRRTPIPSPTEEDPITTKDEVIWEVRGDGQLYIHRARYVARERSTSTPEGQDRGAETPEDKIQSREIKDFGDVGLTETVSGIL